MFDNAMIDVALGLIFFYMILSLVVTSAQEWFASLCKLRSKNLKKGIDRLVGDELAQQVYRHSMIRNLAISDTRLPSYIDPKTLSAVLLDIVARDQDGKSVLAQGGEEIRTAVERLPNGNPIGDVLKTAVIKGDDVAQELSDYLGGWFDEGMQRISGWYKREAKLITLALAVLVTVVTNAGTIHIAEQLWVNDSLRTIIAAEAVAYSQTAPAPEQPTGVGGRTPGTSTTDIAPANSAGVAGAPPLDAVKALRQFPIGYPDGIAAALGDSRTWIGWVLTIAAISLGAPFWYDLLGKVASIKGAGGSTNRGGKRDDTTAGSA
ncbi:MAG: hypothetical protein P1U88_06430 [Thalassobaculaceae bacterium]|nr:hypothetical protein [Thalassobaculaceae bacterium]